MVFPERHVTRLFPKAMRPAEKMLVKRICAYMGFRVKHRRSGWIIIEVPLICANDDIQLLRPSILSLKNRNGVLFGNQPPEYV